MPECRDTRTHATIHAQGRARFLLSHREGKVNWLSRGQCDNFLYSVKSLDSLGGLGSNITHCGLGTGAALSQGVTARASEWLRRARTQASKGEVTIAGVMRGDSPPEYGEMLNVLRTTRTVKGRPLVPCNGNQVA